MIHLATDASLGTDPDVVAKGVEKGTVEVLSSAAKTPSIKRVVLTSSNIAIYAYNQTNPDTTLTAWNDEMVKLAYELPSDHPIKAMAVYAASKTLGEQAAWKYMREQKVISVHCNLS